MASTVPSLLVFSVLSCTLLLAEASPPPPPTESPSPSPAPAACTDELVLFSPCLYYVASPPNDLADTVSANCCNAFSAAVKWNAAVCFCYLLQEPPIFGFPLNRTRLLSLSSDCPLANGESDRAPSLSSLCSESPALPPLNHYAYLGHTVPSTSGSGSGSSSPVITIPSKGGGGARGGSSGGRGRGTGSTPRSGGSSSVVGGAVPYRGNRSSSEMTEICRNRGWLLLWLLSLVMSYIC